MPRLWHDGLDHLLPRLDNHFPIGYCYIMFKEIILPLTVLLLIVVVIALAGAALSTWLFQSECAAEGGTYSVEGFTAWCRY